MGLLPFLKREDNKKWDPDVAALARAALEQSAIEVEEAINARARAYATNCLSENFKGPSGSHAHTFHHEHHPYAIDEGRYLVEHYRDLADMIKRADEQAQERENYLREKAERERSQIGSPN
jgi:hypothetical protein